MDGLDKISDQTASNNYSRVDFISTGSRWSVGLVKENLSAENKQLTALGNLVNTHWQLRTHATAFYTKTGYNDWNNHGHYTTAMNKVCSIINTDYWEENLFGNGADLPKILVMLTLVLNQVFIKIGPLRNGL